MPLFSLFKSKGGSKAKKAAEGNGGSVVPQKQHWEDAWSRNDVAPEEIHELVHECTHEMKSRALETPFMLLPFRPGSDATAFAKVFIRNFFRSQNEGSRQYTGLGLQQELRLTEPTVLCSILKWCWSRLPNGVVTWDAYELFRVGEQDSNMARNAFHTFIPISVDSEARKRIIFDFFDLLAAIAARGKTNGLGGRKLSRMAGWWAFEHSDDGKGFDGGYRSWTKAADASSHLFFAYLRSLSPDSLEGIGGIAALPRSLQALLTQTEYPPESPALMMTTTKRVVMIVDSVSPTPFALLRRAKHFEYRDDDESLQRFSSYEDPVRALTEECRRVLNAISATNQSSAPTNGAQPTDGQWTRFEDYGFSSLNVGMTGPQSARGFGEGFTGLKSDAQSHNGEFGRPTTPSWADFLSSGFPSDGSNGPMLLTPEQQLPPLSNVRGHSSQSHVRNGHTNLEPGELASINTLDLDDTFWWVWMTSLSGEETTERKAAFGRCALIETEMRGAKWLIFEEQVKGASPGQEEGAYIVEKKSRFGFSRRTRLGRKKSTTKKPVEEPYNRTISATPSSRTIGPEQHAKIQAAAARLAQNQHSREVGQFDRGRNRLDDQNSVKTNSVLTLQPVIMNEAAPAMKWAKEFDRDAIRAKYLGDVNAGRGPRDYAGLSSPNLGFTNGSAANLSLHRNHSNRELPALPPTEDAIGTSPRREALSPRPNRPATPPTAEIKPAKGAPTDPTLFDEKPQADSVDQHPAYRSAPKGSAEAPPAKMGETSSPESKKSAKADHKKLKKERATGGGGGFKKLFGRKKQESSSRSNSPLPVEEVPAAEPPKRRMSLLRNKPSPVTAPPSKPIVDQSKVDTPFHEPTMPSDPVSHSQVDLHRPSQDEERDADRAFSRFDQGPINDMPAFVPDDSPIVAERPPSPPQFNTRAAGVLHPSSEEPEMPTREAPAAIEPTLDNVSEASEDLSNQVSPQDRWAQIRKNAAERAARVTDEPPASSRRSHSQSQSNKTDDGDTSGEETIESRVARIKARVAELTGNMDAQGNITTGPRR